MRRLFYALLFGLVSFGALAQSEGPGNAPLPKLVAPLVNTGSSLRLLYGSGLSLAMDNKTLSLSPPVGAVLGGVVGGTCGASTWVRGYAFGSGAQSCSQPTFPDIAGVLTAAQMPALSGDCTTTAGSVVVTCTGSQGVSFGTAAFRAIGTSGATVPLLSAANTWSAAQTFTVAPIFSAGAMFTGVAPTFAAGAVFSMSPTVPTPAVGDNSTKAASTQFVLANAVSTVSPAFSGTPTAPTAAVGTKTTQLATTAFVQANRGRVLLNTLNASNSSVLQDTTSISGAYTNYVVEFDQVIPNSTNATFQMLVQQGGSFATASYLGGVCSMTGTTSACNTDSTDALLSGAVSTSFGVGTNGHFRFNNPASTGKTVFSGVYNMFNSTAYQNGVIGAISPPGAITGLQWRFSSGTIASGQIRIYGVN